MCVLKVLFHCSFKIVDLKSWVDLPAICRRAPVFTPRKQRVSLQPLRGSEQRGVAKCCQVPGFISTVVCCIMTAIWLWHWSLHLCLHQTLTFKDWNVLFNCIKPALIIYRASPDRQSGTCEFLLPAHLYTVSAEVTFIKFPLTADV